MANSRFLASYKDSLSHVYNLGCRFSNYSLFMDIHNSFMDIQQSSLDIHNLNSDIHKSILDIHKLFSNTHKSSLDIQKSVEYWISIN